MLNKNTVRELFSEKDCRAIGPLFLIDIFDNVYLCACISIVCIALTSVYDVS